VNRVPSGGSRHKASKAVGPPDLEDADPYKGLHSAIEEEVSASMQHVTCM
jgi:hypothetical protein